MIYDNGKEIDSWTSIDNEVLEKIYRIKDLSKLTKDVLVSLCRQIFRQNGDNVMSTSGWGAANVTAKTVGCSERSVRRAYNELVERNIISKVKELRERNIQGNPVPREVNWITINTDTDTWKVKERGDDNNLSHDRKGSCRDKNLS